jgi:ribonuclease PH
MNVVMNSNDSFIEIQGTAEGHAFNQQELNAMLELAKRGISDILQAQRKAIES